LNIKLYEEVQNAAKEVHAGLFNIINSESTEKIIVGAAIELLREQGVTDTWYHGVPAFVLLGSRSCESISGRDYVPSSEQVGETNLVTVDLSPMLGNIWGDCARSFYVENGVCTNKPECIEFQEGASLELELHKLMISFVSPNTLFSELYEFGNHEIRKRGFENLDFLGNLGIALRQMLRKDVSLTRTAPNFLVAQTFLPLNRTFVSKTENGDSNTKIFTTLTTKVMQLNFKSVKRIN